MNKLVTPFQLFTQKGYKSSNFQSELSYLLSYFKKEYIDSFEQMEGKLTLTIRTLLKTETIEFDKNITVNNFLIEYKKVFDSSENNLRIFYNNREIYCNNDLLIWYLAEPVTTIFIVNAKDNIKIPPIEEVREHFYKSCKQKRDNVYSVMDDLLNNVEKQITGKDKFTFLKEGIMKMSEHVSLSEKTPLDYTINFVSIVTRFFSLKNEYFREMLELERDLRLEDSTLKLMHQAYESGGDWLEIAELIQYFVIEIFGYSKSYITEYRRLPITHPELADIPIQVVNNISRKGELVVGDNAPNTSVVTLDGVTKSLLDYQTPDKKLVIIGLSRT